MPNAFRVEVAWIEFLGSYVRARLDGARDRRRAGCAADLSVNAVRRLGIAEGRSLPVRLPPERLRVYPAGLSRGDARADAPAAAAAHQAQGSAATTGWCAR